MFVFNENVELKINLIVPFDSWTMKLWVCHTNLVYMSINAKVIADFVFSVAAILNINLDYEKNIVYSLRSGFIWFFDHTNVGFAS